MKLMLTIAYDILKGNRKATFKQIWAKIFEEQKSTWKSSFPDLSMDEIEKRKRGELFTYLTTDGRFVMVDDQHWGLIEDHKFSEIKKMRINIGENNNE